MKTFFKTNLLLILLSIFAFSSCKQDEPDVVIDKRDVFEGTWNVIDHQISKANYQVYISKDDNNSDKVWLRNFHGTQDTAFAYISNKNISIANQTMPQTGLGTGGSGLMIGTTKIDFEYYIFDGAQQDTISATYTK